jgi:hypothetical protein
LKEILLYIALLPNVKKWTMLLYVRYNLTWVATIVEIRHPHLEARIKGGLCIFLLPSFKGICSLEK